MQVLTGEVGEREIREIKHAYNFSIPTVSRYILYQILVCKVLLNSVCL